MTELGEHALSHLGPVALRATVLLVLATAVTAAMRRGPAALRLRVWSAAILVLAVLPVVAQVAPAVPVRVLPAASSVVIPGAEDWHPTGRRAFPEPVRGEGPAVGDEPVHGPRGLSAAVEAASHPSAPASETRSRPWLLMAFWLLGMVFVLARSARARMAAARLARRARVVDRALWPVPGAITVRESEETDVPLIVGAVRPVIVVPAAGRAWPAAWRAAAAEHELAHIRTRDPVLQAVSEVVTALYWFHPLVWLAARQLRIERELAADDQVLLTGTRPSAYAEMLVSLACAPVVPGRAGAVVPLLTPAGLRARLRGVLDGGRPRVARTRTRLVLGAVGVLVIVPAALAVPVARPANPLASDEDVREGRGQIIGRALDAAGRPVPDAEVFVEIDSVRSVRVAPGRDGWFRFPYDETSYAALSPREDPFGRRKHQEFVVYARKGRLAARRLIRGGSHGTILPVDFHMRETPPLRGTVRHADGTPAGGVSLWIDRWTSWAFAPARSTLAVTDDRGEFEIVGLMYGDYRLVARHPSGAIGAQVVTVGDGGDNHLNVTLTGGAAVTVRVQDAAGRPLPGVRALHRGPAMFTYGFRHAEGVRYIDWDEADSAGGLKVAFWEASRLLLTRPSPLGTERKSERVYEPVHWSLTATDRDGRTLVGTLLPDVRSPGGASATIVLVPAASVTGTVRAPDGRPATGAIVAVGGLRRVKSILDPATTFTDRDGRFTFRGVEPDNVEITATHSQGRFSVPGRTVVKLAPGQIAEVDLTLQPR